MNIDKEIEYLYKMLGDIAEERRQLTIMAREFKTRLDELNRFKLQGIDELSVEGWTDIYNQTKKENAARNIARETAYMEERMRLMFNQVLEEKFSTLNTTTKKAPFPSMSEMTRMQEEEENQPREKGEKEKEKEEKLTNEEQVSDKQEVQEVQEESKNTDNSKRSLMDISSLSDEEWRRVQKNLQNKEKKAIKAVEEKSNPKEEDSPAVKEHKTLANGSKRKAYVRKYDIDKIFSLIVQVLKEEGIPLDSVTIYEKVQELYGEPIDKVNFSNNMLYRLFKKEKRISRPQRGYYQYDFSIKD